MLSQELTQATNERAINNPCTIALMLSDIEYKHGVDERDAVTKVLMDTNRVATNLAPVLQRNGYNIKASTIRRHRKGQCSCR